MDYFPFSFPIEETNLTTRLTNTSLNPKEKNSLNQRYFYKFLGIMVSISRFQFTSRKRLRSPTSVNKYIPVLKLGSMTGMARRRLDNIWSGIQWGDKPSEIPDNMSQTEYRCLQIDEMVKILNKNREDSFISSECICVVDSI